MTAPEGRRGNGLQSADWGALVDLDPRIADSLLDRLAAAGVAAYVEPAGSPDAVSRAVQLPSRPLDRLWVDPSRAAAARVVVTAEMAELTRLLAEQQPGESVHGLIQPVPSAAASRVLAPPVLSDPGRSRAAAALDDDEEFRRIVADFEAERPAAPDPGRPAPTAADDTAKRRRSDAARDRAVDPTQPDRRDAGRRDAGRDDTGRDDTGRDKTGRRDAGRDDAGDAHRPDGHDGDPDLPAWLEPAALADDGHYQPPPPPPVGRLRPRTMGAAAVFALGLLLLFAPRVIGFSSGAQTAIFGVLLLIGGAAMLVWWMRDAPPVDTGPDDGAVV